MFKTYANDKTGRPDTGKPIGLGNRTAAVKESRPRRARVDGNPYGINGKAGLRTAAGYQHDRYNPAFDRLDEGSVVEDWIPRDQPGIHKMLRLIYLRDEVGGPMVDIYKEMAWGDFDLHYGHKAEDDTEQRRIFEDSAAALNLPELMPSISGETLIIGRNLGTLLFDNGSGTFTGLVPHDPDFCLTGDTRIITERGLLHLDSLGNGKSSQPGMSPLKLRLGTEVGVESTSHFGHTKTARVFKIDTEHGFKLKPSGNHAVRVLDTASLQFIWKRTDQLVRGDMLCVKRGTELWPKHKFDCSGYFDHAKLHQRGNRYNWVQTPQKVTAEVARLLGYLIGDGTLGDGHCSFSNVNPEIFQDFLRCYRRSFPDAGIYLTEDTLPSGLTDYRADFNSSHVVRFLEYLGAGPSVARTKTIPHAIRSSPRAIVIEFIRAYLECDGSPHPCGMTVSSASEELLRDLQLLLLNLDVLSYLHSEIVDGYEHKGRYWKLSIAIESAIEFDRQVGFISTEKRTRHIGKGRGRFSSALFERLPWVIEAVIRAYSKQRKQLRGVRTPSGKLVGDIMHQFAKKIYPETLEVMEILGLGRELAVIRQLLTSKVTLTAVTKIKRSKNEYKLYDLSVPGSESFLANGLVVHNCKITPVPIYGHDPLVDLRSSPGWKYFMDADDERIVDVRSTLPPDILDQLSNSGFVPLEPVNTVFIRRRANPYDHIGTSIFTRLINFLAIQKALLDSTVIALRRRSAGILHIVAGHERWEPTTEELADLAGMWMQAEEDQGGGIVVTRDGVQADRGQSAAADLWKLSDEWSFLSEGKMRALGVSDAFLAGDATWSNMEMALSVFLERLRGFRDFLTNQFIYERIFQTLARAHGFVKPDKNTPQGRRQAALMPHREALKLPASKLIYPELRWHKSLHPVGDESYISILDRLKEAGVPVTMEHYAAAGGFNLKRAMGMTGTDIKRRKQLEKWRQATQGGEGAPGGEGGGEEGGGEGGSIFGRVRFIQHPLQRTQPDQMRTASSKALDQLRYWDQTDSFSGLSRSDAQRALRKVLPLLMRGAVPPKKVLAQSGLGGREEQQSFRYLLTRLGFLPGYKMSPTVQRKITAGLVRALPAKTAYQETEILASACTEPTDANSSKPHGIEVRTGLPNGPGGKNLLTGWRK